MGSIQRAYMEYHAHPRERRQTKSAGKPERMKKGKDAENAILIGQMKHLLQLLHV